MFNRSLKFSHRLLLCALALFHSEGAMSTTLSLDAVLESSATHFPAIQAAVQQTLIQQGKTTAALGAFDLALEQESTLWASGFFDGGSADTKFSKRLPYANSKIEGGYRLTNDDFPIYQQELVTNSGGEFNLGVVFSLWRNRDIDPYRFAVARARLGEQDANIELMMARVITQRNAGRAYWQWVGAGQRLVVYETLRELAATRMVALERRAEAGDIAKIFLVENRQNLLRREALLTNAKRDFTDAAIRLSLYYRDDNGFSQQPTREQLPKVFPAEAPIDAAIDQLIAEAQLSRPELRKLAIEREAESLQLSLSEQALKPRVDFGVKASHDLGRGSRTREGFDTIVDLSVSIPLERRRGRGLVAESKARIAQIDFERRLAEDQISVEILSLANAIDAAIDFVEITAEEANQATIMEEAERKRFDAGASDFFLVNIREERSADARIRNIGAHRSYQQSIIDFHATTVDLPKLGLDP